MKALRLAFMGTPDFAVPALQALIDGPHEVVAVYSQPPRPKGRGKKTQKSPVQQLAEQHDIQVYTPSSFKKEPEAVKTFQNLGLDAAIVAAYGLILPEIILETPKYGCLNIHASLLPRWRGASPIQQAIWKGDRESGVSIMQMDKGLDTGPVIAETKVPVGARMTASELHDRLAAAGGKLIAEVLDRLATEGKVASTPQDDTQSCYAPLLTKENGHIDWTQNAIEIDRQVRALNPWPGVWTTTQDGKRLKIRSALAATGKTAPAIPDDMPPGTILDKKGHVACSDGTIIQLLQIQPDNAKAMDFPAAINGNYVATGECLS